MKALLFGAALFASVALTPKANAQQIVIGIGTPPPVCPYGYYDYPPYTCAAPGFYGPGYFYNGIFLGVGPWYHWGYGHGWGRHRFIGPRGGRYFGNGRGRYYGGRHDYGRHYEYRGRHDGRHIEHGHGYRGGEHGGGYRGHGHGGGHGGDHGGGHGGGHGHR